MISCHGQSKLVINSKRVFVLLSDSLCFLVHPLHPIITILIKHNKQTAMEIKEPPKMSHITPLTIFSVQKRSWVYSSPRHLILTVCPATTKKSLACTLAT